MESSSQGKRPSVSAMEFRTTSSRLRRADFLFGAAPLGNIRTNPWKAVTSPLHRARPWRIRSRSGLLILAADFKFEVLDRAVLLQKLMETLAVRRIHIQGLRNVQLHELIAILIAIMRISASLKSRNLPCAW